MKVLSLFFLLAFIAAVASATDHDNYFDLSPSDDNHDSYIESSLKGIGIKGQNYRRLTCDKFPRICRAKGSPGPDCCKKRCVNVMRDGQNCGMCGRKCKYGQICCRGNCVNPSFDRRHCGGCNHRCDKGELCAYGMCNYA